MFGGIGTVSVICFKTSMSGRCVCVGAGWGGGEGDEMRDRA